MAGTAYCLVDANDPDNERRFTTAHELAHFLLDYAEPRRKAIEALGEGIVPVLDGVALAHTDGAPAFHPERGAAWDARCTDGASRRPEGTRRGQR